MRTTDDPSPRPKAETIQPFAWPISSSSPLALRASPLTLDLCELLEQRQTRRSFETPLEESTLGEFLWLACRNRSVRETPAGVVLETRVYPSAGAMHPIHILAARNSGPWVRYDPVEHTLVELPGSTPSATAARETASRFVQLGNGVLFGLVAESTKTAAKYENYETLVWRDAGVVLGYMSLIAEALNLAFCPLGATGKPFLTDFLSGANALEAVGLAVLGKSATGVK